MINIIKPIKKMLSINQIGVSVNVVLTVPRSKFLYKLLHTYLAKNIISQLKDTGEIQRAWLGVRIQNLNSEVAEALGLESTDGALVTDVPDGPAKEAGIKSGDVIIEFDGVTINDSSSLVKVVGDSDVGKDVSVLIWRDGNKKKVTVTLGRLETVQISDEKNQRRTNKVNQYAGMSFTDLNDEIRKRFDLSDDTIGVVVIGINDDSPAAARGILAGDIIQKVDQVDIQNSTQILKLIEEAKNKNKSSILFLIKRGSNVRFIAIPVE